MGEYAVLNAPCLQGLAGQATSFLQAANRTAAVQSWGRFLRSVDASFIQYLWAASESVLLEQKMANLMS